MKLKSTNLPVILSIFCISFSSAKVNAKAVDTLYAASLKPYDRYLLNASNRVELISSAVHFGFSFEGGECQVLRL